MKKTDPIIPFLRASLLVTALTVSGVAQTTAFTYQGKLTDAGNPANGNYDYLRFQNGQQRQCRHRQFRH